MHIDFTALTASTATFIVNGNKDIDLNDNHCYLFKNWIIIRAPQVRMHCLVGGTETHWALVGT